MQLRVPTCVAWFNHTRDKEGGSREGDRETRQRQRETGGGSRDRDRGQNKIAKGWKHTRHLLETKDD